MACCSTRSNNLKKINKIKATKAANAAVAARHGKPPTPTKHRAKVPPPAKIPPCKHCGKP